MRSARCFPSVHGSTNVLRGRKHARFEFLKTEMRELLTEAEVKTENSDEWLSQGCRHGGVGGVCPEEEQKEEEKQEAKEKEKEKEQDQEQEHELEQEHQRGQGKGKGKEKQKDTCIGLALVLCMPT